MQLLKNLSRLFVILATMFGLSVCAFGADVAWMNDSGGNWNNGANWSTGTVPTSVDNVYINYPGTYVVALDMNPTVHSLNLGGVSGTQTLRCISWELTVTGTVNIDSNGVLDISASNLNTTGDFYLNNDGRVELDLGSIEHRINNTGDILITRTCTFPAWFLNDTTGTLTLEGDLQGSATLTVDTGFVNRGTIDFTASYPVTSTTYLTVTKGSLVNEATGTINTYIGSSFPSSSNRWLTAQIENAGTIHAVDGGLVINKVNATHTNSGTYYAEAEDITFSQAGSGSTFDHTGTITTDTGGSFSFDSDTFTWPSGTITNNGVLSFLSVDVTFTPKFTNTGRLELVGSMPSLTLTDSLINDGTVYLVTGDITGATLINNDSLIFQNGTVNSDVHNNGVIYATIGGTLAGACTTTASSKMVVVATSMNDCFFTVANTFTNHGEIELTQTAYNEPYMIVSTLTDSLINASDGVISARAGEGSPAGMRYLAARLYNEGTVDVVDANMTITQSTVSHTNVGTINVSGANLTVSNEFTNSGSIVVDTTRLFSMTGRRLNLDGGSFSGTGKVSLIDDTTTITGSNSTASEFWFTGGLVNTTGTLTNTGTLRLAATNIDGTGTITNQNVMTLYSSTVDADVNNEAVLTATMTNTINGTLSNGINDTIRVEGEDTGSGTLTVANSFTNNGVIVLTSNVVDAITTATLNVTSGTLTNNPSGVIIADNGVATGGDFTLGAQIHNEGLITNSGIGLVIEKASADHTNNGTINLGTGAIDINLTGTTPTFTNTGIINFENLMTLTATGGTFANATTGRLTGTGSLNTYATTFTNDGRVSPGNSAGSITMQANNFPMDVNAQIDIEIGGLTAITEHDRVYCTQNAVLGGVLNISLIDDYIPTVGDSFLVLNYNARIGNFLAVLGLTQNGITFDTNFTAGGLYIVTEQIDNDPPVITGMPETISFTADTSTFLGIWNYVSDDHTNDSNMTYTFTVSNDSLYYTLNAAGFLILTADTNYSGDVTLGLTATDAHGASASDTTIVTVLAANTAPVIAGMPDSTGFDADSSLNFDIWSYVTDTQSHDSLLTYDFTVSNDSLVFAYDTTLGIVTVSSISGYNGVAWLNLTVTDPGGKAASDSTKFVITYNFAPVISGMADTVTFRTDSTTQIDVFFHVSDTENADAELTYTYTVSNDSLQYSWDGVGGMLTLSAGDGFVGQAFLYVTVADTGNVEAHDTVLAIITAIPNEAPVITGMPDSVNFRTDSTLDLNIWSYVSDAETHDSLLTYTYAVSNDSLLYAWADSTGILTLSSTTGFLGDASLFVTIADPEAAEAADTIVVTVREIPNETPVVDAVDSVTFQTDATLGLNIWSYVSDAETHDSLLTYAFTVSNDSLVASYHAPTGSLALSATGDFVGVAVLYLTVTDPDSAQASDSTIVTVTAVPNEPAEILLPDTVTFDADTTTTLDIFSLVTDESHDTLLYYAFSASNDSLIRNFDTVTGILTLSAESGFSGEVMLYLTITDPDTALSHDTSLVIIMPALSVGDEDGDGLPDRFALSQNYPNPFNPTTIISYSVPEASYVRLTVYNLLGQYVETLVDVAKAAGIYQVTWDGHDENGRPVATGVYFYRLEADNYAETRKMLLLK